MAGRLAAMTSRGCCSPRSTSRRRRSRPPTAPTTDSTGCTAARGRCSSTSPTSRSRRGSGSATRTSTPRASTTTPTPPSSTRRSTTTSTRSWPRPSCSRPTARRPSSTSPRGAPPTSTTGRARWTRATSASPTPTRSSRARSTGRAAASTPTRRRRAAWSRRSPGSTSRRRPRRSTTSTASTTSTSTGRRRPRTMPPVRCASVNFARDIVDAAPSERTAIVELTRDGRRRTHTFGQLSRASSRLAGSLSRRGVSKGAVVLTLVGNRAEWVQAMIACFRLGALVLPCTEQLRAKDLELRLQATRPRLILADPRNREQLEQASPQAEVLYLPFELDGEEPAPAAELEPEDGCLITFTSGTSGEPKAVVHGQRYLLGQHVQAEHWLDAREGDLVWCTAASGWSKSARNVFIAPWIRGAAALLHDARFDPEERLALLERERVDVLCMAPTEYRVIAKRARLRPLSSLRELVAAGEALNPEVLHAWRAATGLEIRDGYGQTETGQLTGMPVDEEVRPGSMGRPLPGVRLWVDDGELVADPETVPTFFLRYLGEEPHRGEWRTGDRVTQDDDGFLYFEGRADDVIISAGYRIGPFEVESALVAHAAVAEAAVVAAPDEERGSVVRAVVVLRDGFTGSDELARELQEHVKALTAPYKYPRIVEFASDLPKTASGKVRRALLRGEA